MTKQKKKSKKNKKQIISVIILALTICLVTYILYVIIDLIKHPTDSFILENGEIAVEESTVAYIIRDEELIENDIENTNIEQIKKEGEKVAKGSNVFKYYNINEEEVKQELEKVNQELQEALDGKSDLLTGDVKAIENQIETKLEELRNKNNVQGITEDKEYIENAIVKKAKIAGSLSAAGEYINSLIAKRTELENKFTEGTKYVVSPKSGVVSYRIDNLEKDFVVGDFSYLTKDFLNKLDLKTGKIVTTSNNMAKVVNNFECYMAIALNSEEAKEAKEGDKIKLRLLSKEVPAIVEKIIENKGERIIVFKITQEVESLIEYRKVSAGVIWWANKGLKIPKSAIIYDNGHSYIEKKVSGNFKKVLVKITVENENYCLVENYEAEELKELGFTAEDINNMYTIKLYDEIMANPEIK